MPKFVYEEYHQVVVSYEDEFDVTDKEKWEMLRRLAEDKGLDEEDLEEFPVEPPEDVEVWFELYSLIDMYSVADRNEDWQTERKGGFEIERTLLDDNGRVVMSDR